MELYPPTSISSTFKLYKSFLFLNFEINFEAKNIYLILSINPPNLYL